MNIFALDIDPRKAAQYHCDKHVVKMIVETAQMLSTVHHLSGGVAPYRPTHKNHPCVKWIFESEVNYEWLLQLGFELCAEYTHRYNRTHKTQHVLSLIADIGVPDMVQRRGSITPFALAMPDEYKEDNTINAYQRYYCEEKFDLLRYTDRDIPWFVQEYMKG